MTAKQPARPEAATAMLKEIESYCKRTKTPEQTIGHALFRHPGFVGLLRLRLMLSAEKEAAVRQFMRAWPNGYHGDLPHMFTKAPKPKVHPVRHTEAAKLTDEETDGGAPLHAAVRRRLSRRHRAPDRASARRLHAADYELLAARRAAAG
jgi:hypothetical protein